MSASPVHVFLPCRRGSQRILHKNTRSFADIPGGLLELKLRQLSETTKIASITVNTDDPEVMRIAEAKRSTFNIPLYVSERPAQLASAGTLDDFVAYVPTVTPPGIILWTHVTSPFFGSRQLDNAVCIYRTEIEKGVHDSLMGVSRIQSFLWNKTGCISHDRMRSKWPQTQDLEPVFEVNSSIFMIERDAMSERCDRIGDNPYLLEIDKIESIDIDWSEDFYFAEKIYKIL